MCTANRQQWKGLQAIGRCVETVAIVTTISALRLCGVALHRLHQVGVARLHQVGVARLHQVGVYRAKLNYSVSCDLSYEDVSLEVDGKAMRARG